MSKILKLNSYSRYDELGDRDYMVYEVEYDNGHKEYVSRDTFRNLKALEIIKNIGILKPYETSGGQCWLEAMCDATKITKDNCDLLKEVLL